MTSELLPEAVGCERLTEAFRRSGVLGGARVSDVAVVSSRPTILSRIIRLRLAYEGHAPDSPRTIIFKTDTPTALIMAGAAGTAR